MPHTEFKKAFKVKAEKSAKKKFEGREHSVTVHFSRKTRHDYVEEAFRKIFKHSPLSRSKYKGIQRNLKFLRDS